MPNPKPVGNRTARRGRKLRRLIALDDEAARALRAIVQMQHAERREDQIVKDVIMERWRDLDASIEDAARVAAEGETS